MPSGTSQDAPVQITINIGSGRPPSGSIRIEEGEQAEDRRFEGWLDLLQILHRLLDEDAQPAS